MNSNNFKWCVKYGSGYAFKKYFTSREDAIAFSIEVNGALQKPLYSDY